MYCRLTLIYYTAPLDIKTFTPSKLSGELRRGRLLN